MSRERKRPASAAAVATAIVHYPSALFAHDRFLRMVKPAYSSRPDYLCCGFVCAIYFLAEPA